MIGHLRIHALAAVFDRRVVDRGIERIERGQCDRGGTIGAGFLEEEQARREMQPLVRGGPGDLHLAAISFDIGEDLGVQHAILGPVQIQLRVAAGPAIAVHRAKEGVEADGALIGLRLGVGAWWQVDRNPVGILLVGNQALVDGIALSRPGRRIAKPELLKADFERRD